jgi:hypothetical protein
MHTQLGSSGSAALGAAAAQMRKGYIKDEPINVIAFCGADTDIQISRTSPHGANTSFST